jgi:chromate reductase
MLRKPKILAFAGSLRAESFNKIVLRTAAKGAEAAGAEVTFVDLADFPMPLFNSDDEEKNGLDPNAARFQELLAEHDGFLIASPEYNGSFTAALKNVIDWATRPGGRRERSEIFQGKYAAIMTASPGSFGGIRVLAHLRGVLTSIGVHVLPTEIAVPFVSDKCSSDGRAVADEKTKSVLETLGASLAETVRKMRAGSEQALGASF